MNNYAVNDNFSLMSADDDDLIELMIKNWAYDEDDEFCR